MHNKTNKKRMETTTTPIEVIEAYVEPQPDGMITIECIEPDCLPDDTAEGRTVAEALQRLKDILPASLRSTPIHLNTWARSQPGQPLMLRAIELASEKHLSQTDKAGRPYFGHPVRVAARCQTDEQRMVALMHDLLEDTDVTAQQLLDEGFPAEIVEAVLAVTRRQGEDYEAFIERAATNPIARRVKIADLLDNMDVTRLTTLTDDDCQRLKKYHRAWRRLAFSES